MTGKHSTTLSGSAGPRHATRRTVLQGATAVALAPLAATPAAAVHDPVMSAIAAYREARATERALGDAAGNFVPAGPEYEAANEAWKTAWRVAADAMHQAFATPATTIQGAISKLQLLREMTGPDCLPKEGESEGWFALMGQYDPDNYETLQWSAFDLVLEDFARLSNGPAHTGADVMPPAAVGAPPARQTPFQAAMAEVGAALAEQDRALVAQRIAGPDDEAAADAFDAAVDRVWNARDAAMLAEPTTADELARQACIMQDQWGAGCGIGHNGPAVLEALPGRIRRLAKVTPV